MVPVTDGIDRVAKMTSIAGRKQLAVKLTECKNDLREIRETGTRRSPLSFSRFVLDFLPGNGSGRRRLGHGAYAPRRVCVRGRMKDNGMTLPIIFRGIGRLLSPISGHYSGSFPAAAFPPLISHDRNQGVRITRAPLCNKHSTILG